MPKTPTTWNFKLLLGPEMEANLPRIRNRAEQESYKFINKWKDRTDYLESPEVLKRAIDEYEKWVRSYGPNSLELFYFELKNAQDQNDAKIKAGLAKATELSVKIQNDIHFFTLKLGKVPSDKKEEFLNSPVLQEYKHFLEIIFKEARYTLSEPEEKILTLESEPARDSWIRTAESFLSREQAEIKIKGKKQKVNYEELMTLISHRDKKIRDEAGTGFNKILANNADIAEAEINAVFRDKKIRDELRGFERPDSIRHLSDDIDSDVVDALNEAVIRRFDISARYYKLKAKLLGQAKLEYHERNVPLGKVDKEVKYDEAIKLSGAVFEKLDPSFKQIFDRFVSESQIDVFPRLGKTGGGFCASSLADFPTYILLNHTDRLGDVLTIAHEIGHAINHELQKEKQNAVNIGTPMCTAEVASTFMEDFILQEILLQEKSDAAKLSIALMKLNSDVSSIFRQIGCYQFEKDLHEEFRNRGYLSKQEIGKIFQKNMKAYMGPAVVQSPGSENWWVYWGHIRNFFYVYSYASGLLISKTLQKKVKENPEFISDVKEFLAAGSSASPRDIFLKLGIDITNKNFWTFGLEEIDNDLKNAEALAKKLNYKI